MLKAVHPGCACSPLVAALASTWAATPVASFCGAHHYRCAVVAWQAPICEREVKPAKHGHTRSLACISWKAGKLDKMMYL